jgi:hypothetical protein
MTFYFNRETGQRVSKSTWKRSHAQGGTRFVRRSESSTPTRKHKESAKPKAIGIDSGTTVQTGKTAPSQNPRTWKEYQDNATKKFKKRIQSDDFDYDSGVEYETGVDY